MRICRFAAPRCRDADGARVLPRAVDPMISTTTAAESTVITAPSLSSSTDLSRSSLFVPTRGRNRHGCRRLRC